MNSCRTNIDSPIFYRLTAKLRFGAKLNQTCSILILVIGLLGLNACTNADPQFTGPLNRSAESEQTRLVGLFRVTQVWTSDANRIYSYPEMIEIFVSFSAEISLDDSHFIELDLALDSIDRSSQRIKSIPCRQLGKKRLSCTYVVGRPDFSVHLNYASTASLRLLGSKTIGVNGEVFDLTLPELGDMQALAGQSELKVNGTYGQCDQFIGSYFWTQYTDNGASGTAASPYLICTEAQLIHYAQVGCPRAIGAGLACDAYIEIGKDIDFGGREWITIGSKVNPFLGNFDGGRHMISNIRNYHTDGSAALFGALGINGFIKNLSIYDVQINSTEGNLGGLVDESKGIIEQVHLSEVSISITTSGTKTWIGGLVGQLPSGGEIRASSFAGRISVAAASSGNIEVVGGLVGESSGRIDSSFFSGGEIVGFNNVGGLVGTQNSGSITNSSVLYGQLSVANNQLGGLVGLVSGATISDCHIGNVTASGNDFIGGLIGYSIDSLVTNSSSGAKISGDDFIGGLIGLGMDTRVKQSFYAGPSITGDDNVGGLIGELKGSSSLVQDNYAVIDLLTTTGNNGGGLLGQISDQVSVARNYVEASLGASSTGSNQGPFVGNFTDFSQLINFKSNYVLFANSFSDIGGKITYLDPSSRRSSNSYPLWNFNALWEISNEFQRPILKFNSAVTQEFVNPLVARPDSTYLSQNTSKFIYESELIANDLNFLGSFSGDANKEVLITAGNSDLGGLLSARLDAGGGNYYWIYTPPQEYIGVDSLSYELVDRATGAKTSGQVDLHVNGLYEDFNFSDSTILPTGWIELSGGPAAADAFIQSGRLSFNSGNASFAAGVTHVVNFPASGIVEWSFDFDYQRIADEFWYGVFLQLGDSSLMQPDLSKIQASNRLDGVAISFKWAGDDPDHARGGYALDSTFGWEDGLNSSVGFIQTDASASPKATSIKVTIDMDTKQFFVTALGKVSHKTNFYNSGIKINQLRIVESELEPIRFNSQSIDNMKVTYKK